MICTEKSCYRFSLCGTEFIQLNRNRVSLYEMKFLDLIKNVNLLQQEQSFFVRNEISPSCIKCQLCSTRREFLSVKQKISIFHNKNLVYWNRFLFFFTSPFSFSFTEFLVIIKIIKTNFFVRDHFLSCRVFLVFSSLFVRQIEESYDKKSFR